MYIAFLVSELTYRHTIKLEDGSLTFEIRDTLEKVRSKLHRMHRLASGINLGHDLLQANDKWQNG